MQCSTSGKREILNQMGLIAGCICGLLLAVCIATLGKPALGDANEFNRRGNVLI